MATTRYAIPRFSGDSISGGGQQEQTPSALPLLSGAQDGSAITANPYRNDWSYRSQSAPLSNGADTTLYDGGGGNQAPTRTAFSRGPLSGHSGGFFNTPANTPGATPPPPPTTPNPDPLLDQVWDPNRIFSDPATTQLEELIHGRVDALGNPVADPQRDALLRLLTEMRDSGPGADEAAFQTQTRERINFLQGDPFSDAEEKAIQVANMDRLERDRTDAKRREADRLMRLGHEPSSGTITAALRDIDRNYDMARAQAQTDVNLYTISEKQRRAQEATTLGEGLTSLERSGEERRLGFGGLASDLETGVRSEQDARDRERLQTAALPNELQMQRFQLALQALGLGGSPSSLINALTGIASTNNQAANDRAGGYGSLANLLTTLAGINYGGNNQNQNNP